MANPVHKPGEFTDAEIHSQPLRWAETLAGLRRDKAINRIVGDFKSARRWLFIGCGSSYYLALSAAASWKALTGLPAQAAPASELLLYPELTLDQSQPFQPVLISRSGTTSEVLQAADYLKAKHLPFLLITCTPGEAIEKSAAATICPSAADEKSTVMTLSFTSMLIAIQYLAGSFSGNDGFLNSLRTMPEVFEPALGTASQAVKSFVGSHEFADYVWLGQGPYFGLACEGALKVKEMSCSYAQSFHTLEFRHGPKSIVGPETLIMLQISEPGFEGESGVLEEVKDLGGTTLVVVNEADERVRGAADLLVELHLNGHEFARLAPHIVPAQLLGLYTGLKKGNDPDNPRNLSRVVILNERS